MSRTNDQEGLRDLCSDPCCRDYAETDGLCEKHHLGATLRVLRRKIEILERNGHDETARILRRVVAELLDCGVEEN